MMQDIYSRERIEAFQNQHPDAVKVPYEQVKCGILHISELQLARQLLKQGQLVAFPTETVYGLGANALNSEAVLSIFRTKKRPLTDPVIVHLPNSTNIYAERPLYFDELIQNFWPGPFTIVVKSTQLETTQLLSANTGYIGLRVPRNDIALNLLSICEFPIAAPSANLFTHISPTTASHVFNDFYDQKVHIIDGGRCQSGIESTVVKLVDKQLHVLRLGSLAVSDLQEVLNESEQLKDVEVTYQRKVKDEQHDQEAPGQLLKHYAPYKLTYIVEIQQQVPQGKQKVDLGTLSVIDFGQQLVPIPAKHYQNLSERRDAQEAMYNLYDALRVAENQEVQTILLVDFEQEQQAQNKQYLMTLCDKIFRSAAGQKVIFVDNQFYF